MRKLEKWIWTCLALALFTLPITLYVRKFGLGMWTEHSRWAELGSYFSGVYSPIIALLAFAVLLGQVYSQNRMNKYQYDSTFLNGSREELDFYLARIETCLEERFSNELTVREFLLSNIATLRKPDLDAQAGVIKALTQNELSKIFRLWIAIYPVFEGLKVNDEVFYRQLNTSSQLKFSVVLSYRVCESIDKVYYAAYGNVDASKLLFWRE